MRVVAAVEVLPLGKLGRPESKLRSFVGTHPKHLIPRTVIHGAALVERRANLQTSIWTRRPDLAVSNASTSCEPVSDA